MRPYLHFLLAAFILGSGVIFPSVSPAASPNVSIVFLDPTQWPQDGKYAGGSIGLNLTFGKGDHPARMAIPVKQNSQTVGKIQEDFLNMPHVDPNVRDAVTTAATEAQDLAMKIAAYHWEGTSSSFFNGNNVIVNGGPKKLQFTVAYEENGDVNYDTDTIPKEAWKSGAPIEILVWLGDPMPRHDKSRILGTASAAAEPSGESIAGKHRQLTIKTDGDWTALRNLKGAAFISLRIYFADNADRTKAVYKEALVLNADLNKLLAPQGTIGIDPNSTVKDSQVSRAWSQSATSDIYVTPVFVDKDGNEVDYVESKSSNINLQYSLQLAGAWVDAGKVEKGRVDFAPFIKLVRGSIDQMKAASAALTLSIRNVAKQVEVIATGTSRGGRGTTGSPGPPMGGPSQPPIPATPIELVGADFAKAFNVNEELRKQVAEILAKESTIAGEADQWSIADKSGRKLDLPVTTKVLERKLSDSDGVKTSAIFPATGIIDPSDPSHALATSWFVVRALLKGEKLEVRGDGPLPVWNISKFPGAEKLKDKWVTKLSVKNNGETEVIEEYLSFHSKSLRSQIMVLRGLKEKLDGAKNLISLEIGSAPGSKQSLAWSLTKDQLGDAIQGATDPVNIRDLMKEAKLELEFPKMEITLDRLLEILPGEAGQRLAVEYSIPKGKSILEMATKWPTEGVSGKFQERSDRLIQPDAVEQGYLILVDSFEQWDLAVKNQIWGCIGKAIPAKPPGESAILVTGVIGNKTFVHPWGQTDIQDQKELHHTLRSGGYGTTPSQLLDLLEGKPSQDVALELSSLLQTHLRSAKKWKVLAFCGPIGRTEHIQQGMNPDADYETAVTEWETRQSGKPDWLEIKIIAKLAVGHQSPPRNITAIRLVEKNEDFLTAIKEEIAKLTE